METSFGDKTAKLKIRNLSKSFSLNGTETQALQDVTLDVFSNEFCAVVGPSGCGKTTLLRLLAGLEQPTSGEVLYGNCNPNKPKCNLVFQEQAIFPWMTVWENIAFGLRRRGVNGAELNDIVKHFLNITGLSGFWNFYPYQLSGGMKQRVGVARAFANDPEILLMDEPFASLDEQNKTLLQDELLRIWEETKKTVVFITHSIDEALVLGDRVLVMTAHPGTLKADLAIDFARPRAVYELKASPEFGELAFQVWSQLRDEVVKA